jgi:hypothetical protein
MSARPLALAIVLVFNTSGTHREFEIDWHGPVTKTQMITFAQNIL